MDSAKIMLLRTARRKGCDIFVCRPLPPAISREDHSSFAPSAFACSGAAPLLREISKDMEQLFATKQRSDATVFHVSKLAQRCRDRDRSNVLNWFNPSNHNLNLRAPAVLPTSSQRQYPCRTRLLSSQLFCGISVLKSFHFILCTEKKAIESHGLSIAF